MRFPRRAMIAVLTTTSFSTIAAAQEAPSADAVTEPAAADPFPAGEIIVTAQRRQERVQDIPVSVSAFGAAQIERAGIGSLENIAPRVPSFYFGSFGASRPQLYIRGIGTRSFDPGSESSVGVFVDDVYLGRSSGSFGSLKDIERIEVLRGPQGTLYGRNTIAGAINVISKAPTRQFEGVIEGGISNFDGYEFLAAVGGPVTADGNLAFRAAGWRSYRDGYVTNTTTGTTFQGLDNYGGRLRLAFEPGDGRLRIDLTGEFLKDENEAAFAGFNRGSGPRATAPANPASVFLARPGRVPVVYSGGYEGALSLDPTLEREAKTAIGRIEYDAGFANLTSISAFRNLETSESRDLEGSSLAVIDQFSNENSDQFSQEFRVTSNPTGSASFGGAVDWIVGAYYYRDRSSRTDRFELGPDSVIALLTGGPQTDVASSDYEIDSYALFGQATVHLGERFDLTAGGRFTRDEKRAVQSGATTRPGAPLVAVPFTVDNRATYESFDPKIVLAYKFSPDVNLYASYSTGFKSGGFQYVPFAAPQANVLFAPEDIKAYEIGFKSEWLNRKLRFNLAGYYYDYKNLQVSRIVDLGGGAAASLITNAASSTIKGVDMELLLRPSKNIDVSIAYGYLDAKYDEFIADPRAATFTDFSGTRLVRSPEHTVNLGVEWRVPVGESFQLTLGGDYALLSDFFHEPGEGQRKFGGAVSLSGEDGYGLLDLRASVDVGNFRVTGFVNNVFDTYYRRTVLALGSTLSDFPGAPRIYGIKAGYRF